MSGNTGCPRGLFRATTYLAPGLPRELFEGICEHLGRHLGNEIELTSEARHSGPMHGDFDPFRDGSTDLGFLCSPSFLYLRSQEQPSVRLIPAALSLKDPRAEGHPVYFSEVVVREDHTARGFGDLAGGIWGYNDECSLSGYFSTLFKLSELGCGAEFFAQRKRTGSHEQSLLEILNGSIHGAAIDSSALAFWRRRHPELANKLRVIDSWGPFPIQPIVIRDAVPRSISDQIEALLLNLGSTEEGRRWCDSFGLEGFVPIDEGLYAEERETLIRLGAIPQLDSPRCP